MPNTLVHFGLQGGLSRTVLRSFDRRFVYLACVLPDVPWIGRRVLAVLAPHSVDPLDVRLFVMAQSSLVCTLVLCGAIALVTRRAAAVFLVLAANSLLHLLLDAAEIKWGSGVLLLAPASFRPTHFGWLWPDGRVIAILTFLGLGVMVLELARRPPPAIGLALRRGRFLGSLALVAVYFALPVVWMPALEASGGYSIDVLRRPERRTGQPLAVERNLLIHSDDGAWLELWSGERLRVEGSRPDHDALVSIRGHFMDAHTVRIEELHEFRGLGRDLPTYLAFLLLVGVWLRPYLPRYLLGRGAGPGPSGGAGW